MDRISIASPGFLAASKMAKVINAFMGLHEEVKPPQSGSSHNPMKVPYKRDEKIQLVLFPASCRLWTCLLMVVVAIMTMVKMVSLLYTFPNTRAI